jgi:hypothetical protein
VEEILRGVGLEVAKDLVDDPGLGKESDDPA